MTHVGFMYAFMGKYNKLGLKKCFFLTEYLYHQCVFTFTDIFGTVHQKATHNKALSFIQMRSINVLLFFSFPRELVSFFTLPGGSYNVSCGKSYDISNRLHVVCQSSDGKSALDIMIDNCSSKLYYSF